MDIRNPLTKLFVAVLTLCCLSLTVHSEDKEEIVWWENCMTGKCLRYRDGNASLYELELATCDVKDTSQQTVLNNVVDVWEGKVTDGAPAGQYECDFRKQNQQWNLLSNKIDIGTVWRFSIFGKNMQCLSTDAAGNAMKIWTCKPPEEDYEQCWKIWHRCGVCSDEFQYRY